MPALYHEADLTLCLSEIPEGFGLAAAESVASGTPVLATRSGFLGRMLPAGHGLHLVEHSAPSSALADAALEALVAGRSRCLARGRPHIAQHYGLDRMQRAYADLVDALLARRNHSPAGARAVRLDAPSNARQSPPSSHRIGSWDA